MAGLRAVLEVRHSSWFVPEAFDLLRKAGVALRLHDARSGRVLGRSRPTSSTSGDTGQAPASAGRTRARLLAGGRDVRSWLDDGLDVYVYFNNDGGGAAVQNARRLANLVGRL